jgi:hypothetical protein
MPSHSYSVLRTRHKMKNKPYVEEEKECIIVRLLFGVKSCEYRLHQEIYCKIDNNNNTSKIFILFFYLSIYYKQNLDMALLRAQYLTFSIFMFYSTILFFVSFSVTNQRDIYKPWMCETEKQSRLSLSRARFCLNHPYRAYARNLSVSLANVHVHFCSTIVANETSRERERGNTTVSGIRTRLRKKQKTMLCARLHTLTIRYF